MMLFRTLSLTEDGVVTAKATGHADEVVKEFHAVCSILLTSKGPWRIINVAGSITDDTELDSNMTWTMTAKVKS